ncbi:MAG: hypothetical protein U0326_14700 [Polyangiales bacterium]
MPRGLARRARAAFYNRGILLHETGEAFVPGVHLKVDSPELHHTLSRDDVRRDAAFANLLARARAIAAGPLAEALSSSLRAPSPSAAPPRATRAPSTRARRSSRPSSRSRGASPSPSTRPPCRGPSSRPSPSKGRRASGRPST